MAADGVSTRPYRALLLDDGAEWRRMIGKTLRGSAFVVDEASDPRAAALLAEQCTYHLLIFDIKMKEQGDDREGLDLLHDWHIEGKTEPAIVVVISQHAGAERTREAFKDYGAADVLDKRKFDNSVFGERMLALLREKLHFNPALQIGWVHGTNEASEAIVNLKIAGTRIKRNTPLHTRILSELDDLLCRLFWKADSILVSSMPTGRSGAGILRVDPIFSNGPGTPVVVKFGNVADIKAERQNYEDFVESRLTRVTSIVNRARTQLVGGICYRLLGADEFEPYAAFYSRENPEDIRQVIDNLFLSTCQHWYTHTKGPNMLDLAAEYREILGMSAENLAGAWKELKTVQGAATLKFESLNTVGTIKNPIPLAQSSFSSHWYLCDTHGDLNGGNILIDPERKTWLIDFLRTGPGHVLRDHAFLDVYTRCALLGAGEATLDERLVLENALLQLRGVDATGVPMGRLGSENTALLKAFDTSRYLRALAAKHGRHRIATEMADYDLAMMFYAMNMIRFYHLSTVQKEHGLLAAGLLAERLRL